MYLTLAIFSMLGYALQTALMAGYYRRFDPLSATAARGLSLGLSMLPILLLARSGALAEILQYPGHLLGASMLAAVGNWSAAKSFRYLPVGIAVASQQGVLVLTAVGIGLAAFGERPGALGIVGIVLILSGNVIAVVKRDPRGNRLERSVLKGFLYCAGFGVFLGGAISLVAALSRAVDPFATAYCWEITIGVIAALMVLVRARLIHLKSEKIDFKAFRGILLCASPTLFGTGCYAVASTMGPISILAAVLSTTVVAATVISYFVHGERLSRRQMVAVAIVVGAMIVVRISAPA